MGWKCLPGPDDAVRGTAEQKARIIAESYESGETVTTVARRHEFRSSCWDRVGMRGTAQGSL